MMHPHQEEKQHLKPSTHNFREFIIGSTQSLKDILDFNTHKICFTSSHVERLTHIVLSLLLLLYDVQVEQLPPHQAPEGGGDALVYSVVELVAHLVVGGNVLGATTT